MIVTQKNGYIVHSTYDKLVFNALNFKPKFRNNSSEVVKGIYFSSRNKFIEHTINSTPETFKTIIFYDWLNSIDKNVYL